jgi:L-malate glycosyltransferase
MSELLTVMMATRNGARTLPVVLDAYVKLRPPEGGCSIVIADNGSTDGTKDIIHAFAQWLPLTYVYEPTPGKNRALNAALSAAAGDLIVFTDDDAVPRADWLQQLRAAADKYVDFHMFGGRIVPRWLSPPEAWISTLVPLSIVYGISPDLPAGPVGRQCLFGANMAVRKTIFDLGYRFDPTIGPRGADYAQGGEAELTLRLDRAGYRAWFCPDAVVEHMIGPDHLREQWILGRARRYGRGRIRRDASERSDLVAILFHLAVQAMRIATAQARRDRPGLFRARWGWHYLLGQAQELRAVREPPRPSEPSC